MVHSGVYLNEYVVSIAPFSTSAFTPPLTLIQKTGLFCMFTLCNFSSIFPGGSADPICPYVRTPVETSGRIELIFDIGASINLSYTVLQGNSSISKRFGTSLWNFVPNSGLGKFRRGQSIALSTKLVVVVVDAVYYKSVNCNPLTPSLRFVVDLLYSLFLQSTRY